jgi:hypothetical protein
MKEFIGNGRMRNRGRDSEDEIHLLTQFGWDGAKEVGVYVNLGIITRKMAYNYIAVSMSEGKLSTHPSHEGN